MNLSKLPRLAQTVLLSVIVFIVVAVLGSLVAREPVLPDSSLLRHARTYPFRVKERYAQLLASDPGRIEYWYGYAQAHTALPPPGGKQEDLMAAIASYNAEADPHVKNCLTYARALCWSIYDEYDKALAGFSMVRTASMPYLNNSIGHALMGNYLAKVKEGRPVPPPGESEALGRAARHCRKELHLKGNMAGAAANLATILYLQRKSADLMHLRKELFRPQDIPTVYVRWAALVERDWFTYFHEAFVGSFRRNTLMQLAGVLLIMVFWLGFLRRIDIFEPEPLAALLGTVVMGMGTVFILLPFHDQMLEVLGVNRILFLQGPGFLHLMLIVGIPEEAVKLLPYFIMIRWSGQVNESADYVIYAMASALGFATLENLQYAGVGHAGVPFLRAVLATVVHLSLSGLAGYGVFLGSRSKGVRRYLVPAGLFLGAAGLHGLYDYVVMMPLLPFLRFLLLPLWMWVFYRLLRHVVLNTLNQSEFFSPALTTRIQQIYTYLVGGFVGLFAWYYLTTAFFHGARRARYEVLTQVIFLFFLPWLLGTFYLRRGAWEKFLPTPVSENPEDPDPAAPPENRLEDHI